MNDSKKSPAVPIDILLVEDDPSDVLLTKRSLKEVKLHNSLSVVKDGVEALQYLRGEGEFSGASRPDLILLDLNMPRMDGRELLQNLKSDANLSQIPVVILTTSDAEKDITDAYQLQASCFVTKPVKLDEFTESIRQIRDFWFTVAQFPAK